MYVELNIEINRQVRMIHLRTNAIDNDNTELIFCSMKTTLYAH